MGVFVSLRTRLTQIVYIKNDGSVRTIILVVAPKNIGMVVATKNIGNNNKER